MSLDTRDSRDPGPLEGENIVTTSSEGRRKRILVVDDSKTALFMMTMVLRNGPYDLITAEDGEEGFQKATTEVPDLILMDVMMPRMSGFEATRALRQQAATRDIPIILVTTRGEETNVATGFEAGCSDYVTKPINSVELLTKVRDRLGC